MLRALRLGILPLALVSGILCADTTPSKDSKETVILPEVDLHFLDGSTTRVVVLEQAIDVETRYGKLTVPCAEIRKMELSLRLEESTAKRLAEAIQQLGSKNFLEREAASKELLRLSIPAYQSLKTATASKDPEVARRSEALVKQIESAVPAARLKGRSDDFVQARDFTIIGKVKAQSLQVRSKYFGEKELKISDVQSWDATVTSLYDVTAPFANATGVAKVAYWFERGDYLAAQATAAEFAKGKDVSELATLFGRRRPQRPGLGIGFRPGEFSPDGIEQTICRLDAGPPFAKELLEKHAADLARAFYLTAAIGEGHRSHCPVKKKEGKKDPKDWERWSVTVRDQALELASAFRHQQFASVPVLARSLNQTCVSCHEIFRECN
jgi:hypothetical protein